MDVYKALKNPGIAKKGVGKLLEHPPLPKGRKADSILANQYLISGDVLNPGSGRPA